MKKAVYVLAALIAANGIVTCTLAEEVRNLEHKVSVVKVPVPVIVETSRADEAETAVKYSVPLEERLQAHVISVSEENGIEPEIVFAMAWRESRYDAEAVGDGGDSIGLLQIQTKWHWERMKELGCLDLYDPYQNVTVGVDYLGELLEQYGDIGKALTAYNRGGYNGVVSEYAHDIISKASELEEITYVQN